MADKRIKRRVRKFRVRSGDSYTKISRKLFGTSNYAAVLARLNRGVTLHPGMVIKTNVGRRAPRTGTAAAALFGLSPTGVKGENFSDEAASFITGRAFGRDPMGFGGDGTNLPQGVTESPIESKPGDVAVGLTTRELQGNQPLDRTVTGGLPVGDQQFPDLTSTFASESDKQLRNLQLRQERLEAGGRTVRSSVVPFASRDTTAVGYPGDVARQTLQETIDNFGAPETAGGGVFKRSESPGLVADGEVVNAENVATTDDLTRLINEQPTDHPDGLNFGEVVDKASDFQKNMESGYIPDIVSDTVARESGWDAASLESIGYTYNPDTGYWERITLEPSGSGIGGNLGINDVGFGRNLARSTGGGGGSATSSAGVGGLDPRLIQSRQSFD